MEIKISSPIHEGDPFYRGASLCLPASKIELLDAMDAARIRKGEAMKISIADYPYLFLEKYADIEHADFEELNFLARELHRNHGLDQGRYENVIAIYASEHKDRPLSLKELINAFSNMDRFDFYHGIHTLKTLGKQALDEGLETLLGPVPEEVYSLLDLEKLGHFVQEREGGVFTSFGYGVRSLEGWEETYSGSRETRTGQEKPAMIDVYLENDKCMESGSKIWLSLPCEQGEIEGVAKLLKAERLKNLRILKTRSLVPHLKYLIDTGEDLGKLNELAKQLIKLELGELIKYKAVLEYLDEESLTEAIRLIGRLDSYTFCPEHLSYGDYGRTYLQGKGIDCSEPAFSDFDFEAYGKRRCEEEGVILTSYGSVACVTEPIIEESEGEESEAMNLRMEM